MLSDRIRGEFATVAFIQHKSASALAGGLPLAIFHKSGEPDLRRQISTSPLPRSARLDFTPLLDMLSLQNLAGNPSTDMIIGPLRTLFDDLIGIFQDDAPPAVFNQVQSFFHSQPRLQGIGQTLGSFLEGQFGIALSLITTLRNLVDENLPQKVIDAVTEYFFATNGYATVDETNIAPPTSFGALPADLASLKSALSEKSGERYLRDLINIVVDTAGDTQYRLRLRYPDLSKVFTGDALTTAKRWFKGFGSMAEAGVMSSVEETLLGIGQFSTNPLLAAAAGTYAGTAARKAVQHVFLSEVGIR